MKFLNAFLVLSLISVAFLTISSGEVDSIEEDRSFTIDYEGDSFLKDGKKFRYVSGSIHSFRSTEDKWDDLLRKFRLAGLNAITTYIAWDLHQPTPELKFNYEGNLNLFKFIETAQKNDLHVILRPGPYMDAERDMGGLPAWLLWENPNMTLRTSDLDYVYFVSHWFDEILPKMSPYLYENGGPIIMVQVENEYGSYSCDKNYTTFLRDLIRLHLGENVVLFSTDGDSKELVKCGNLPGVYPTIDFGPKSPVAMNRSFFEVQREFAPKGPLINSEFYTGWIDHWQKPHSKTSVAVVAQALDTILALGANVNMYMFHGGTSFAYGAGANVDDGMYDPNPTTYDYDAPLTEAGDPTEKYFAIKSVISKYMKVPEENPVVSPKGNYGKVGLRKLTGIHVSEFLTLFGGVQSHSALPKSFEELRVSSGFVLYQVKIKFIPTDPSLLTAAQLKDRAYVYVDKIFQGIISRQEGIFSIPLMVRQGQTISILVENQGRVCFGHAINESKVNDDEKLIDYASNSVSGLGKTVTLGSRILENWEMFALGEIDGRKLTKYSTGLKSGMISNVENLLDEVRNGGSGSIYVGNFTLPSSVSGPVLDTYVRLDGFTKGILWVNGFNLGRYWPVVGPQVTLYLPASLLHPHPSTNIFMVFELERVPDDCLPSEISFSTQNGTENMYHEGQCFITLTDTHVIDAPTPLTKTVLYKKGK